MSKHAKWITPENITIACMSNHAESISNILNKEFDNRESAILTGIANNFIRISLIDDKWLLQINKLTTRERTSIQTWANRRKINRPVSIEILGGENFHKAETNIVELADGVDIGRRKVLKKAYIAPALIALHGLPTHVIAPSGGPGPDGPGNSCGQPNPPKWCP